MSDDPMTAWGRASLSTLSDAERIVGTLGLEPGASFDQIVAGIGRCYEKSLVLQAVGDNELSAVTGLWIETEDSGYVFFREADPFVYQVHSIFHEFGHILANHGGCDALGFVDRRTFESVGLGQQIRRARARGAFHEASEILAEEIAYALSRLVLCGSAAGLRAAFE